MNIYLISQSVNNDYDTYDSAVVVAESEDEAKNMHPDNGRYKSQSTWTKSENVVVKLVGTSADGIGKGVICASFNAG